MIGARADALPPREGVRRLRRAARDSASSTGWAASSASRRATASDLALGDVRRLGVPLPRRDPVLRPRRRAAVRTATSSPATSSTTTMLATAAAAGATVHEETSVTSVDAGPDGRRGRGPAGREDRPLSGKAGRRGRRRQLGRRRRASGLTVDDPRYIAVAQRAYATVDGDVGEAAVLLRRGPLPRLRLGVPAGRRRVNLGVGILSETRERPRRPRARSCSPTFVEGLRACTPRQRRLELCCPPIGGIVKTYGAAGPNHFDGGVLVGDAGSFVDPMTGEGITPAMESALLAAPVSDRAALDDGPVRCGPAVRCTRRPSARTSTPR